MTTRPRLLIALSMIVLLGAAVVLEASFVAQDPGVRGGPAGAGDAIASSIARKRGSLQHRPTRTPVHSRPAEERSQ
jgi:hypothetical protein